MARLLEKIAEQYNGLKESISDEKDGYRFARDLTKDIRQRCTLVTHGMSDPITNVGIVLQLAEYEFILDDIAHANEEGLSHYTAGAMMYWLTHRKDLRFMNDLYDTVFKKSDVSTPLEKTLTDGERPLDVN